MIFRDDMHKALYEQWTKQTHTKGDPEYTSMFYVLAADEIAREHITEIFDFSEICIKPKGLFESPWITSTAAKSIRFAFNLYNWGICADRDQDGGEITDTADRYTPAALFACSNAPYFLQALKIRYPEYFKSRLYLSDDEI